jgi:hypothetical protein
MISCARFLNSFPKIGMLHRMIQLAQTQIAIGKGDAVQDAVIEKHG